MNDKEKFQQIELTRGLILCAQEKNNKLYEDLINLLGIEIYSQEEDHLFDLVFNTPKQDTFKADLERWKSLHKRSLPKLD